MLRNAFAQIISGFILCALAVGWWLAADQDFARMGEQAWGLISWGGSLVSPLFEKLFGLDG